MVTVEIPSSALLAIKHRALENPREEVCGVILRGEHIAVDNTLTQEQRSRRFRMDPDQQMKIWESWRRNGTLIVYHSHPIGGTYPSDIDKWVMHRSGEDVIHLIYATRRDEFTAYRAKDISIVTLMIKEVEESTQQDHGSTVTNGPT